MAEMLFYAVSGNILDKLLAMCYNESMKIRKRCEDEKIIRF